MLWNDGPFLVRDKATSESLVDGKVYVRKDCRWQWKMATPCLVILCQHLFLLPAMFLLLPPASATFPGIWDTAGGSLGEVGGQQALKRFVRHYEKVNYDQQVLHQRVRRSLANNKHDNAVQLNFASHNRKFQLRLQRDTSAFTTDHVVTDGAGQALNVDTAFLYQGKVQGQPDSLVHGSIRHGLFEGKIHLPQDVFVVEASSRYFKPESGFHSIIYSEKDVIFPESANHITSEGKHAHGDVESGHNSSCGLTPSIRRWMEQVQSSADTPAQMATEHCHHNSSSNSPRQPDYASIFGGGGGGDREHGHGRKKRAASSTTDHDRNRLCNMYIQTDKFLWDAVYEREKNEQRTREEILSIISSHIKAVTRIYGNHRFGDIVGVQFAVQRTTINDSSSCAIDDRNPFCQRYLDVSNLLNYNSMMDHSGFCLAFLFTYRDFAGGTLGLAWVASANGPSGGICETYKRYTETIGGKRVQTFKSLNTGVITFVNYGNRVPPTVSHLTLAHEIGHNFGAAHDPNNPLCQPNGADGNYIMYPSATNGDRPNNDKFSSCSLENMTAVLKAVLNQLNGKRNCFVPNDLAYCGNKIVEKGEECDCGYNVDECKESCCYPRQLDDRWLKEPSAKECTLRFSADLGGRVACSPSQGPCCSSQCTFTAIEPTAPPQKCRQASECTETAFCHSQSAVCPAAIPKPDILPCDNNSKVCKGGECNASICLLFDMEQCFLTEEDLARAGSSSARANKEAMCFVACQFKDRPETCISTRNNDFPFKTARHNVTIEGGIRLRAGAPCNNFRGYCDIFHRCRKVDGDGPLRRLTTSLFSAEALESAASWITTHWWAVMLMGIGLVIVMGGIIKCCAVHTPSSNPKKRPARRLADDWHSISSTLKRTRRSRPDGVHHHRERNVNRDQARHRRGNGPSSRPNRRRDRGNGSSAQPSAPTDATMLAPAPSSIPLVQIHLHNGLTTEPPPPYSSVVNETAAAPLLLSPSSNAAAGPKRGHRKNRRNPQQQPSTSQGESAHNNQDQTVLVLPNNGQPSKPRKGRKK